EGGGRGRGRRGEPRRKLQRQHLAVTRGPQRIDPLELREREPAAGGDKQRQRQRDHARKAIERRVILRCRAPACIERQQRADPERDADRLHEHRRAADEPWLGGGGVAAEREREPDAEEAYERAAALDQWVPRSRRDRADAGEQGSGGDERGCAIGGGKPRLPRRAV